MMAYGSCKLISHHISGSSVEWTASGSLVSLNSRLNPVRPNAFGRKAGVGSGKGSAKFHSIQAYDKFPALCLVGQ